MGLSEFIKTRGLLLKRAVVGRFDPDLLPYLDQRGMEFVNLVNNVIYRNQKRAHAKG